jgi:hypothetical protein
MPVLAAWLVRAVSLVLAAWPEKVALEGPVAREAKVALEGLAVLLQFVRHNNRPTVVAAPIRA